MENGTGGTASVEAEGKEQDRNECCRHVTMVGPDGGCREEQCAEVSDAPKEGIAFGRTDTGGDNPSEREHEKAEIEHRTQCGHNDIGAADIDGEKNHNQFADANIGTAVDDIEDVKISDGVLPFVGGEGSIEDHSVKTRIFANTTTNRKERNHPFARRV